MKEITYSLDELRQICGDNRSDIREFIELFVHTMGPSLEEMHSHILHANRTALSEVLHRIRPSVQIFGMKELITEMKALEEIFRNGVQADEMQRLERVLLQFEEVCFLLAKEAENFR